MEISLAWAYSQAAAQQGKAFQAPAWSVFPDVSLAREVMWTSPESTAGREQWKQDQKGGPAGWEGLETARKSATYPLLQPQRPGKQTSNTKIPTLKCLQGPQGLFLLLGRIFHSAGCHSWSLLAAITSIAQTGGFNKTRIPHHLQEPEDSVCGEGCFLLRAPIFPLCLRVADGHRTSQRRLL